MPVWFSPHIIGEGTFSAAALHTTTEIEFLKALNENKNNNGNQNP